MPSPMQPQGRKYASPMLSCQCQRRHLVMRHAQCECYGYCECGFSRCCRCPAEFRTCENTQEAPVKIAISPADPHLAEHLDAAIWQPSMLPNQPPELLGDQKPLFEGGMDKTSNKRRVRDDQPTLF